MDDQNNDDFPYKTHLWKAVETFSSRLELQEEKLRMIENVIERQNSFSMAEISRYEKITHEIVETHKAVAELTEKVNQLSDAIASIQRAPLVVVGFMASLAAVGSAALTMWKHFNGSGK